MKMGFLVDMILLATQSCDKVKGVQMEMVKKKCPWAQKYVIIHMTIGTFTVSVHGPLCFQCITLSLCMNMAPCCYCIKLHLY